MSTKYTNIDGVATWKTGVDSIQIKGDTGTVSEILADWKNTKLMGVDSLQQWSESDEDVTIFIIYKNSSSVALATDIGSAIEMALKLVAENE